MRTVRDVLKNKKGEICSVGPKATVFEALKLMREKEIGALMVMDESGQVFGIVSERDYAARSISSKIEGDRGRRGHDARGRHVQGEAGEHRRRLHGALYRKKVRHLPGVRRETLSASYRAAT